MHVRRLAPEKAAFLQEARAPACVCMFNFVFVTAEQHGTSYRGQGVQGNKGTSQPAS
jgi:hypothetical protein